jgi:hypothetical protein
MKYAVQLGLDAMIYIPSFIKFGSGIERLIKGRGSQHVDIKSLLLFFLNKESVCPQI